MGGKVVGTAAGWIELDEHASCGIGLRVHDKNGTHVLLNNNNVTWMKASSLSWDADGHVTLRSVTNLFDAVTWDTKANVDYSNNSYAGRVHVTGLDSKPILAVEGHGKYGKSHEYW
jgi:hypothetical protein